jgi:ABC-type transport system substrate-binding protein
MTSKMINLKFLLAIAVTAMFVAAVACGDDDEPTPVPAAAVAPAAPAAPAAPPPTPRPVPTTDTSGLVNAQQTAVAVAAALARTQAEEAARRGLVDLPALQAPAAALAATASGDQILEFVADCCGTGPWFPWGGAKVRNYARWTTMPAFMYDKDSNLTQGVATGYTLSDDGRTYTIHINPDAVFHDGSKITAGDVKRSYEYQFLPQNQQGWGSTVTIAWRLVEGADAVIDGDRDDATGIVVVDDETLEINLKQATPSFPGRLAVYLQGIFKSDGAWDDPNYWLHPVGAGPYTYVGDDENNTITLTVADNWWGDPPTIQGANGRWMTDANVKLVMFENGDIDIMAGFPAETPGVFESSHPVFNSLVGPVPTNSVYWARLVTSRPPLDDINIRKALMHAIDFDLTTEAIIGVGGNPARGLLQSSIECWDPNFKGYEYDPEKARAFLAASKYGTAENVPRLAIITYPGYWALYHQAWQAAWKEVLGIDMKIVMFGSGDEVPPDINMTASSGGAHVPDVGYLMFGLAHTEGLGSSHIDDELDAMIERANALPLDDPGRCAAYQEAERTFMDRAYTIPMHQGDFHWLVNPWVQGFETSANFDFATMPFMKIGEKTR